MLRLHKFWDVDDWMSTSFSHLPHVFFSENRRHHSKSSLVSAVAQMKPQVRMELDDSGGFLQLPEKVGAQVQTSQKTSLTEDVEDDR